MTLNINVENKNIIKIFTLATLFTVGVFLLIRMYDALLLVATALFFALALNPAVGFLAKYMPKKKRGPAVAIVLLIAIALVSFIAFSIIKPVSQEASGFAETVPARIEALNDPNTTPGQFVERFDLADNIDNLVNGARGRVEAFAQSAVAKVAQFGSSLITLFTGVVLTILMLLNGPSLLKRISAKIYRDKELRDRHENLGSQMYKVVTGYVNGQVLIAFTASLFALGVLFLLKVPYPLPLAAIVFIFGLIPLIGNTLAAVLVVLFAAVLKDLTSALVLIAYFVIYQQVENVTLQPLIQGKTIQLPTLIIFTSVILGVAVMGPIGGLFAIPAAGCAKILLNDYLEHRPAHHSLEPATVSAKIKHTLKKATGK